MTLQEEKLSGLFKDIDRVKKELKELKKSLKTEEKVTTQQYVDLKKAYTDLRVQIKKLQDAWMKEIESHTAYTQLREMNLQKEEELAQLNLKAFETIAQLPAEMKSFNVQTDTGVVTVQIRPEMRVYLNGKEEKKRGI